MGSSDGTAPEALARFGLARRTESHPTRMRLTVIVLGLALVFALTSCAHQKVLIQANPLGVEVFVDGKRVKNIPDEGVKLRSDRSHELMFRKPGYQSMTVVLEASPERLGLSAVVGVVVVRTEDRL
ncbi:MAG: hypothetical protein ABGY42_16880, partial [bacterium]